MTFDRIIVGLGNPGPKYSGTRHNIGAVLVERFAARHAIDILRSRHDSTVGDGLIAGKKVLLAIPRTYMNLSGQAARKILAFTGTPPSSLVVAHDDLDLPSGRIRLRFGGGAGGHNGIRSLIQHLHSPDFIRLKIGIGRPHEGVPAERYVLQTFSSAERTVADESVARAMDALDTMLGESLEKAMSRFNMAE